MYESAMVVISDSAGCTPIPATNDTSETLRSKIDKTFGAIAEELPFPRKKDMILNSIKRAIGNYLYGPTFTVQELHKITEIEAFLYDLEDIIAIRTQYDNIIGDVAVQRILQYQEVHTDRKRAEHSHCLYKRDLANAIKKHKRCKLIRAMLDSLTRCSR